MMIPNTTVSLRDTSFSFIHLVDKIPLVLGRAMSFWLSWMTDFLLASKLKAACIILQPEW